MTHPRSQFVAWRWLMLSCLVPMNHETQTERWTSPSKVGPKAAQLLWAIRMVVLKELSINESASIFKIQFRTLKWIANRQYRTVLWTRFIARLMHWITRGKLLTIVLQLSASCSCKHDGFHPICCQTLFTLMQITELLLSTASLFLCVLIKFAVYLKFCPACGLH